MDTIISLTVPQFAGVCVLLLLLGGTIAVYGIRFLAWLDMRAERRRWDEWWATAPREDPPTPIPGPRLEEHPVVGHRFLDRELGRQQRRVDAIRDAHLARRRLSDPPPEGMENRITERLHQLGDDLRADKRDKS